MNRVNRTHLFLGTVCEPAPDWKNYTAAPQAPSNYKDEHKIQKYIEERMAKLGEDAAYKPLTGCVKQSTLVDDDGQVVANGEGISMYDFLTSFLKTADDHTRIYLWGFDVKDRLRLMAAEAVRTSGKNAWGLFFGRTGCPSQYADKLTAFDPVQLITGESRIENLNALRAFVNKGGDSSWNNDPAAEAQFMLKAARRFGLLEVV